MVRRASRFRPDTLLLKVTLRGSKPAIWRRLLVPGNFSLAQLHYALQCCFPSNSAAGFSSRIDPPFSGLNYSRRCG